MPAFFFQQPGSATLLDIIQNAANGADEGGAMFAFASAGGAEAFFNINSVTGMLRQRKPLHMIVGIDAITNAEALLCIEGKRTRSRGTLIAEVFLHDHPASTFHPKFAWFRKNNELHLITGSGNLTTRGLGVASTLAQAPGNWEAFSVQILKGDTARETVNTINAWVAEKRASHNLRSLNDERVKARAMANGLIRYSSGRPPGVGHATPAAPIDDEAFDTCDILLRELPKNRPGQADVGKTALTHFFGFTGIAKQILLQHVSLEDVLGDTEKIRLFTNESQNYRLEMRAMAGLPYEIAADDSRLLLVATKLDRRSFRYAIVPVGTQAYQRLVMVLGEIRPGRRLMREKRITAEELKTAWPDAPANLIPVVAATSPP